MPTYSYECPNGHYTRIIQHMREPRPASLTCGTCERKAKRIFNAPRINVFDPFVTYVGDSQRKVVRNAAEAADIEKRFQVAEITSAELKRRGDPDEMRKRREKRNREAFSALKPMKEQYAQAEAEVNSWGKDYRREWEGQQRKEYESFQREVESGRANY